MYHDKNSGEVKTFLLGGFDQFLQDAQVVEDDEYEDDSKRMLTMVETQTINYRNRKLAEDGQ